MTMDISKLEQADELISEEVTGLALETAERIILTEVLIGLRGIIYTYRLIEAGKEKVES